MHLHAWPRIAPAHRIARRKCRQVMLNGDKLKMRVNQGIASAVTPSRLGRRRGEARRHNRASALAVISSAAQLGGRHAAQASLAEEACAPRRSRAAARAVNSSAPCRLGVNPESDSPLQRRLARLSSARHHPAPHRGDSLEMACRQAARRAR